MPLFQTRYRVLLAAGLVCVGLPQVSQAQNAPPVPVKFETIDQVELRGNFYPGAKAEKGASILLLHNIGVGLSSKNPGWEALALKLQANGHSVLTFDFRGHGQSTTVSSEFWKYQCNVQLVKGFKPDKATISVADFNRAYYPMLVNDIAAAKIFLDRRNDNKEGNSSNLILIGAQEGATLGALWLNGEWYRFRTIQTNQFTGAPVRWENTAEGKKVYAGLWLSMASTLGSFSNAQVATWLDVAGKKNQTPMAFFYGDQDPAAKIVATNCVSRLTNGGKENLMFVKSSPIKDAGKLAGAGLLKPNLPTESSIAQSLEGLLKLKVNQDWGTTETEKVGYVWSWPTPSYVAIAKTEGEKAFRMFRLNQYNMPVPGLPQP